MISLFFFTRGKYLVYKYRRFVGPIFTTMKMNLERLKVFFWTLLYICIILPLTRCMLLDYRKFKSRTFPHTGDYYQKPHVLYKRDARPLSLDNQYCLWTVVENRQTDRCPEVIQEVNCINTRIVTSCDCNWKIVVQCRPIYEHRLVVKRVGPSRSYQPYNESIAVGCEAVSTVEAGYCSDNHSDDDPPGF